MKLFPALTGNIHPWPLWQHVSVYDLAVKADVFISRRRRQHYENTVSVDHELTLNNKPRCVLRRRVTQRKTQQQRRRRSDWISQSTWGHSATTLLCMLASGTNAIIMNVTGVDAI